MPYFTTLSAKSSKNPDGQSYVNTRPPGIFFDFFLSTQTMALSNKGYDM